MYYRGDNCSAKIFLLVSFIFFGLIFSFGGISAVPFDCTGQPDGTYCGTCYQSGCSLVSDGRYDTLDYLIGGTKTCQGGVCSSSTCTYLSICADLDIFDDAPQIDGISVSGCNASCDQNSDCKEYSYEESTRTCSYNGGCNPGSCVCDYDDSEVCPENGWVCNKGVSEYRVYDCTSTGCEYTVEDSETCNDNLFCNGEETCNGETGLCQNGVAPILSDDIACTGDSCDEERDVIVHTPNDDSCQNGLYCDGVEYCDVKLGCQLGKNIDCSDNSLKPFSKCDYNPDNNPFTWDVFTGFNSVCNEATDSCTIYNQWDDLTHTCSVSECSAECDLTHSCENKCEGDILSYSGECTEGCNCEYETEDCSKRTCSTGLYCVVDGNMIYDMGDEYSCVAGAGESDCGVIGGVPCTQPIYCDKEGECSTQQCGDSNYICYNGIWQESLTEICNDGIDNNCNGLIDCADPSCVDSVAPQTLKVYGNPFVDNQAHFITSLTPITLTSTDDVGDKEVCSSGVNKIYYRTCLDTGCYQDTPVLRTLETVPINTCSCGDESIVPWKEYTGVETEFNIPEDSEHCIEFYSEDNAGNQEEITSQCVYVDNQPPVTNKTIEEAKTKWYPNAAEDDFETSYFYPEETAHCWEDSEEGIECWKITLETEINMECYDRAPHPVGVEKLCYKIEWDEKDITEEGGYCNGGDLDEEGYCCVKENVTEFTLNEESEHILDYYCEDILGNREYDKEIFKVFGNMEEIELFEKWNLISVPFDPINKDPEAVFSEVKEDIDSVWSYNAEEKKWYVYRPSAEETETNDLDEIETGLGYWIMANKETHFYIGGSLLTPGPGSMPSQKVVKGWNLIGYYRIEPQDQGKDAYCALFSLLDTQEGFPRASSLFGYNAEAQTFIPISPRYGYMDTEKGYWLEMDVEDYYVPSTMCVNQQLAD